MKIKITLFLIIGMLSASVALAQQTIGVDKSWMNTAVRPGDDFFQYSCGAWMKEHPLDAEHSRFGATDALFEENQKQIREMIESFAKTQQPKGSLGQKIGGLYRLAMDSTRRNSEGYNPIKPILAKVQGISSLSEYQLVTSQLERIGISANMFEVYVDADQTNASQNIICINQGGLGLGERDYYVASDSANQKIIGAYKQYLKKLFVMTGSTEEQAQKKTDATVAIETLIARPSYSATQQRDVEGNYHKMTYAQLLKDYSGIDWGNVLLQRGIPAIEDLSVNQPEPIHEVEKILKETPLENLKAYAEAKVLSDAANSLDDNFRAVAFGFSKVLTGATQDRPRWKRAVNTVNYSLGMAVGKMYVEKYFPESSKQQMLKLVENLKTAFGERINASTWMSPATKAKAIDKLSHFIVKVGYPDKWRNYDKLQIDETLSYYENVCNISCFMNDDEIERKVNKPVDKSEWLMTPQTINAYYNPSTNEICFPAGILQYPFFDPKADEAFNYGGIGATIGHEMTHGFDDQGSQFDKEGNVNDWWTPTDKSNFKKRTKVMSDFFSGIELLPGLKCNGELTLGENLADNGGLHIAYLAYKNATKDHPLRTENGFTPDQRFFISYGMGWAESIRPELLRRFNTSDPHSPAEWRVNGALPHISEWYTAFNVKKGNKLFLPKNKRVQVW